MIEAHGLGKRYGNTIAVDRLDFRIERGEIVGFLGPNGAGKTTTLRLLSCFMPPSEGSATVAGYDILRESRAVRAHIGYLPESVPLYDDMRVTEYLRYRGQLKGVSGRRLRLRLAEIMEPCGVHEVRRSLIGTLSKGYRQRVGLADALLHSPDVLLLDEPTSGLDPNQIRQTREVVRGLQGRHTVLISSHMLAEVEAMCQRVLIIKGGRIVAADSREGLARYFMKTRRVVAEIDAEEEAVRRDLAAAPGIGSFVSSRSDGWTRVECSGTGPDDDVRLTIYDMAVRAGWRLRELREVRYCLDDLFAAVTQDGAIGEKAGDAGRGNG